MADVHETAPEGSALTSPKSSGRDHPAHPDVECRSLDATERMENARAVPGSAVAPVVVDGSALTPPRPIAPRRTPREIFDSVKARYPEIMARLAE